MTDALVTSGDGQWLCVRRGRAVELFANGVPPALGHLELESDDAELVFVGPPTVLLVGLPDRLVVHQLPELEAVARLDLEAPASLAAVTGPRVALIARDRKQLTVVRVTARALAAQPVVVDGPIEFAVGLDKHQLLLGLLKKLEVWDAVSGRPLRRMQLALPPAPRTLGTAHGHLWALGGPDAAEIFVYRLSDGRPFRHQLGSPIERVISHPASPVLVLVTARGLVRLQCFAHSLTSIDAPPASALAQLPQGDELWLLGLAESDAWRLAIGGGMPAVEPTGDAVVAAQPAEVPRVRREWREPLAAYGGELARGGEAELPILAVDSELGELAHRLRLGTPARRALIALYALHLVGEPALAIARLARALGEWSEALGTGELAALGMLRRDDGKVALHTAVTDLCDGAPPRAIRLAGGLPGIPRAGAHRAARDGRTDAELERDLAAQLGRIAVIEGDPATALLEARLHGATAIALTIPTVRPRPWPRDAGLVLVLYGAATAWVADLPSL